MERQADTARRVLIAGFSTRALAESAAVAGFEVTAIDAFSDLDQHPSVRSISIASETGLLFSAPAAAHRSRDFDCDAVAYSSNFENHPAAVGRLAAGRHLWGNAPAVLRRVRDPFLISQALDRRALPFPRTVRSTDAPPDVGRWLMKPRSSGGGRGVQEWTADTTVPRGHYLQQFIPGVPGSMVFAADGKGAIPLGFSRQLAGEECFGAAGYRYCGNILAGAGDPQFDDERTLFENVRQVVDGLTEEFGLVGVNGVDFVAQAGVPYVLEVNPRWCASMELVERAYDRCVFGIHADASRDGRLPDFDVARARESSNAVGKAVVFARHGIIVGDTECWLDSPRSGNSVSIRDIPRPGQRIAPGRPVCTVMASGADGGSCFDALTRAADCIYRRLTPWTGAS